MTCSPSYTPTIVQAAVPMSKGLRTEKRNTRLHIFSYDMRRRVFLWEFLCKWQRGFSLRSLVFVWYKRKSFYRKAHETNLFPLFWFRYHFPGNDAKTGVKHRDPLIIGRWEMNRTYRHIGGENHANISFLWDIGVVGTLIPVQKRNTAPIAQTCQLYHRLTGSDLIKRNIVF